MKDRVGECLCFGVTTELAVKQNTTGGVVGMSDTTETQAKQAKACVSE